jgi:acyl-coenzyme A thioesterase 13
MPLGDQDISHISGNVSDEVKKLCGSPARLFSSGRHSATSTSGPIFGESIFKRIVVTEISVRKTEEPRKSECRFVCELTVEDGLLVAAFSLSLFSPGDPRYG